MLMTDFHMGDILPLPSLKLNYIFTAIENSVKINSIFIKPFVLKYTKIL
jgi:hypothetical protein